MPDLWKYYRAKSDTDAETFFAACVTAGTPLTTDQKTAIYNLVGSLKYASLWSKMTALYPFIGGTAATHAINLKSPGTYNIQNAANATWTGATHNSNGVTGNGSTHYGDTGINANTVLSVNNSHLSVYHRTAATDTKYDIGAKENAGSRWCIGYTNYTSVGSNFKIGADLDAYRQYGNRPGFYCGTRTSSTLIKGYMGPASPVKGTALNANPLPNLNIYIMGFNSDGVLGLPSAKNYSFFSVGSGLSDTDAANLSAFVQSYQTALGRAV